MPAIFAISSVVMGIVFFWQLSSYQSFVKSLEQEEITEFKEESSRAMTELDKAFKRLQGCADELASEIQAGKIASDTLLVRLQGAFASSPFLFSFGVAYGPYEYASDTKAFARGYTRTENGLLFNNIDASESYQDPVPRNVWFTDPMAHGPGWIEPYYDPAASATIVEYSCPFYRTDASGKKKAAGIVYADLSMKDVRDILSQIDLGNGGYAMILSKKGKFIAHPIEEYAVAMKSVYDGDLIQKTPMIKSHFDASLRGETGYAEFTNEAGREPSMLHYQPIPTSGWAFWVFALKDYDIRGADQIRKSLIHLTLLGVLFFLLLFITGIHAIDSGVIALWGTVIMFSVLTMGAIGAIWYLALSFTPYRNEAFVQIHDRASLDKYRGELCARANGLLEPHPFFVPTGYFIQSVNFETSNDVTLTGYVWQKYKLGQHDELSRSIVFPEATDCTLTESYRMKRENVEIVGWSFVAKFRQQFDYSRYPIDDKDVWIRAIHGDFTKNVILTPDLDGYPVLNPTSLPGIADDIVLSGWDIDRSFFSYVQNHYKSNFGLQETSTKNLFPELYFTVILKRNFLAPFVTYVLPIFIIACILFTVLLMSTRDEKKNEMFQFSIAGVIATCSGLFFSVLVAHSQLRGAMLVNCLMYLEYFCFVLYLAILGVAANAFLFGLDTHIQVIRDRDNLFPKLAFWPIFLGLMLLVTVKTFY